MPENQKQKTAVLLWGASSQARIIEQMLADSQAATVALVFDPFLKEAGFKSSAEFISDPLRLKGALGRVAGFVTCIGNEHGYARVQVSRCLKSHGLQAFSVMHPKSFVDSGSTLGEGCQMMPFAVLHKFCRVGAYCILNTASSVDHECVLGEGVHVMGGACIAGRVEIGDFATIGSNATVLPGLKIGKGALVGAGAVVIRDVEPYAVVAGNPANYLRKHELKYDDASVKALGQGAHGPLSAEI